MTSFYNSRPAWWVFFLCLLPLACSDTDESEPRPLQPLIYTEYPDLTAEGAAIREDRLMRQLLGGVATGTWGSLEIPSEEAFAPLSNPEILGQTIVDALLSRDEELWEYIFISPDAYAGLVHVGGGEAAEFVDNQMGASTDLWNLFAQTRSSEMLEGGLGEMLEFDSIEIGRGRTVGGGIARNGEEVVQYWGNRITLNHIDSDVTFELHIPRIFRVLEDVDEPEIPEESERFENSELSEREDQKSNHIFKIASEIEADSHFDIFLTVGLHLKPQLLRPSEYPFPLNTGNFWRYRRYQDGQQEDPDDPLERGFEEQNEGVAADGVILEVRQVSQYGSLRLVKLLRAYDDDRYTRIEQWWVLTPRRIYDCNSTCQERIQDLDWLLGYFEHQVPIFIFPLRSRDAWGAGGEPSTDTSFVVDDEWHQVESPAGTFPGSLAITGTGPLGATDRYFRDAEITRYFAPGRGIVRREVRTNESSGGPIDVVEELVEYRISN